MGYILLNYAFLLFWSIIGKIFRELFVLDIRVTIAKRCIEIRRKFVFPTMFKKGQIMRIIWICLNTSFWSNQWKGKNNKKTVFLPKVSHTLLHYAFCCFEAFLEKFIENFSFKSEKWLSQKRALNDTEICFSYYVWKWQILIKFGFV